LFPDIDYANIK